MKQKLFTLIAAVVLAGSLMATDLLSTDFTKGQGAWTINNVELSGLPYVWQQTSNYGMKGTGYADNTSHATEAWLVSPTIDMSGFVSAKLKFSHAFRYGNMSHLSVRATADGEDWTTLNVPSWPDGSNWNFINAEVNLAAFDGKTNVQIAFVYTSTASLAGTWEIKTVSVTANEPTAVSGKYKIGDLYYNLNASDQTAQVTYDYNNYMGLTTANVPSSVTYSGVNYSVTSIGDDAFYKCIGLTSVTIPNSVTSIGSGAFSSCSSLTSMTIPNSVTSIGDRAFAYCSSLTSVTIGNSVTSIGDRAFRYCSSLTSVTIPNSVTRIGSQAFYNCSNLTSVTIPNSVTSIGDRAFLDCSSLTSVTIGNSVTSIGDYAFSGCSGLTSVVWNAKNCSDFSSAPFTSAVTSFTFGSGVEHIPAYLCYGMSDLTSMTIPSSVTSIGNYAFSGCSGLTSVTIPNSVTSIGNYAFSGCSGLTSVVWNAKNCSDFSSAPFTSAVTSFTFGSGVEHIPAYLCYGMSDLTSMTIPSSVTSIGNYAFSGCKYPIYVQCGDLERMKQLLSDYANYVQYESAPTYNLSIKATNGTVSTTKTKFTVCEEPLVTCTAKATTRGYQFAKWADGNTDNPRTIELTKDTIIEALFEIASSGKCGRDSLLDWKYDADTKELTITGEGELNDHYTYGTFIESVTIGNGVTTIGSNAFSNCSNLNAVAIGSNVTNIGDGAFSGCTSLTSIIWNAKNCNSYNFGSQITSFTFGYGVEHIPAYLCRRMDNLTSITIPQSVKDIGEYAFDGCKIKSINFIGTIEDWCNKAWSPSSISAEYQLLLNGELQENVTIPNSVTSVGENTFFGCSSLTSVTIHKSVTSIGGSAFRNCSSLSSVTIPNSITSIGNIAFYGCIISSINFSGTIEDWCNKTWPPSNVAGGYQLLLNGVLQENVTIPNSVTGICNYAFQNCSSLTSVSIPNSVISIGWSAFSGCRNMTTVYLNSDTFVSKDYSSSGGGLMEIFGSQVTKYILGDEITRIGDYAFQSCSSLTSVTIGQSVTSIGERAFRFCDRLTKVNILDLAAWCKISFSDNPLTRAQHLFLNDEEITDLVIPSDVTSIGEGIFMNCWSFTSVTIPNSVTSIGNYAFSGCSSLNAVNIGDSVTSISEGLFKNCYSLTSITIPNSVTSIGRSAFSSCIDLTSVIISNSVTSIGYEAFYECSSLTSVTIGNSVSSIGAEAFWVCSSLTSVTIPNSVKSIGDNAFSYCNSLTTVAIGNGVTNFGERVFLECNNLTDIFVPCGYLGYYKRLLSNDERVKNKTLAYTVDVTTIGEGSVSGADCIDGDADDTIAELTAIPANPYHRFVRWSDGNTDNPRTIILTQDTMMCAIFEYILTDKCGKDSALTWKMDTTTMTLRIYGNGELTSNYTYDRNMKSLFIGDGITSIGDKAFDGCSSLTSLTVGEGVTSIGSMAFYDCENLSSVVWNAISCSDFYVNYPYIYTPFSYMYKNYDTEFTAPIESFTFGNKVKRIPAGLCYGLKNLTTIVIPEGCDTICDNAFKYCSKITAITLPSTLNYIGENAFTTERIMDVYNYSLTPQNMEGKGFDSWVSELRGVLASARLHVPLQSLELYRNAFFWGYFGNILPIQSTTVETNGVNISATETTATVVWPQVNNAATYELVIKDQNGNVVCTLVFDSEGKLVSIAFSAPSRDNSTEQAQAAGFSFTVTGLESGTTYDLTITAKDSNDQTLQTTTQTFTTEGLTSVEDVETAIDLNKVIRNGQLFILRDGKTYTVQGQEVR